MKNMILLLFCFVWIPLACFSQDTTKIIKPFSNKITHSFSIQYNNCIYPKGHFDYHCDPSLGWSPLISYGDEYTIGYNLTTKSGIGFSLEASKGLRDIMSTNHFIGIKENQLSLSDYIIPLSTNYVSLKIKASYVYPVTSRMFIQPEIGITIPYYFEMYYSSTQYADFFMTEPKAFMYSDNYNCSRMFVPDFTFGVNFLFHTPRNPRNNLMIGLNANIGSVPRYTGYFSLQQPFIQNDCDISYGSSYFGINVGYAFVGLPKTFFRKAYRKSSEYSTFDFAKPIHSVSLIYNNTMSVNSKILNETGPIAPEIKNCYSPEIALKYNCTFAKGFGLSIDVPIGLFLRDCYISLCGIVPADTVWANGAVGFETALDHEKVVSIYSGISLRASYMAQIHRNVFIQPELGFSIKPFVSDFLFEDETIDIYDTNNSYFTRLAYAKTHFSFIRENYWIPELSGAINFYVHGKNPQHNFVFGLNFNIDFSKRITIDYRTLSTFPAKYQSSGQIRYNMTTIGLHVGYQFMTGRKMPNIKG